MKAAVIHEYGPARLLRYEDYPDPIARSGEVVVKVAAAGVNPVDAIERTGGTKDWRPLQFPAVLGWDLSGTVVKLGDGVTNLAVGDKVCAWAYHTHAELCAAAANLFAKVPEGIDLLDAAAYPLVALTGSQLISAVSGIKPGDRVLVSGAAGSVARSAVYMAKKLGASKVVAGVRKRQLSQAASIGADETVAFDDDQAFARLPQFDIVANTVQGTTAAMLMGKVRTGGLFASVTGPPDNAKDYPSVVVKAFVSKQDAAMLGRLLDAIASGALRLSIDRRVALREAASAHEMVEKGGTGKIVLVP